jgi:hypothetical protein
LLNVNVSRDLTIIVVGVADRATKSISAPGLEPKPERTDVMKELLVATAPAAAFLSAITFGAMIAPEASAGEFCRRDVTAHMTSCGFDSMEQCQTASAGIGGECFRDPFLDSRNAYAYQPKHPLSKKDHQRRSVDEDR